MHTFNNVNIFAFLLHHIHSIYDHTMQNLSLKQVVLCAKYSLSHTYHSNKKNLHQVKLKNQKIKMSMVSNPASYAGSHRFKTQSRK